MTLPKVYCASQLRHAFMWRNWRSGLTCINIVSTWHDDPDIELKDSEVFASVTGWRENRMQILNDADQLLAYANLYDRPNGTLIEVGMAFAKDIPIHLVGTHPWGSWRHSENVHIHPSLDAALWAIVNSKENPRDPV